MANHDKAVRDERLTQATINGLIERRKGTEVERNAAQNGTYIGDTFNDTPESAQRAMEIELDLSDVATRIAGAQAELSSVEEDYASEAKRFDALSHETVVASIRGQVWETLTAPGEHVNAGQDLLKLLDCGGSTVTAGVSESTYQRLRIGHTATFQPRNGSASVFGWIVGLSGMATVNSNSAIRQSALSREPYHVMLKFPDLAKQSD